MKKAFLSLMTLCFVCFGVARADIVEIGVGGSTNSPFLPGYNLFNYSLSQQIYTADEIGMAGTITSIAFKNTGAEKTRNYNVYMLLTNKENFTGDTDWVAMSDDDLVFSGTLTFAVGEWTAIELDTPFPYDGSSNLIVGVADVTGTWTNSPNMACLVFDATNQAIITYRDNTAYNIANPGAAGTVKDFKNQIKLDITAGAICSNPTLSVTDVSSSGAVLTWGGGSGTYNVQLYQNGYWNDVISNTTSTSFTLSGLYPLTTYEARVQSVCEGGVTSDWRTVSFSTTAMVQEVGNGWTDDFEGTSCGWELINNATGNAWAWGSESYSGSPHALYISNDGGATNQYDIASAATVYATKLLALNTGTYEFSFDWACVGEAGYDFLRVALVSASVSLTANTSNLSGLSATTLPSGWIALDGGSQLIRSSIWLNQTAAVNVEAGNYYMVLVWHNDSSVGNQPPAAVDNVSITPLTCLYNVESLGVSDVAMNSATLVWAAGDASQWQVAYSYDGTFLDAATMIVNTPYYDLTDLMDGVTYYARVRSCCSGNNFGAWSTRVSFTTIDSCPTPTDIQVSDITKNSAILSWTSPEGQSLWEIGYKTDDDPYYKWFVETTENPCLFTGYSSSPLQPETHYTVKVRAICGGDDFSGWSSEVDFTTEEACPTPTLVVVNEITSNSARIVWSGSSETYGLVLTTMESSSTLLDEFFDSSIPADWSNSGYPWTIVDGHMQSGNAGVANSVSTITASVSLSTTGTIEFDAECKGEGSGRTVWDKCIFYIDGEAQFTYGANVSGWNHYKYAVDAGAHTFTWSYTKDSSTDPAGDYFAVDNVIIDLVNVSIEEILVENDTYITLTDLLPNTLYQIQSVVAYCDDFENQWTGPYSFVTLPPCDAPSNLTVTDITDHSAILNWTGDQTLYDVRYNYIPPATVTLFYEDFTEGIDDWTTSNLHANSGVTVLTSGAHAFGFYSANPPQYLISPSLGDPVTEDGTYLQFYTKVGDLDHPESFKVGFSSTDNAISSFTWLNEEIEDYLNWNLVAVPVGTKYFAFQFTSNNQTETSYLYVAFCEVMYNVNFGVQVEEFLGVTNPFPIEGLSPNTSYEWRVKPAGCDEWTEGEPFTTEGPASVTQTTDLTEGWNWFSAYIETHDPVDLLLMLEESLDENGVQIKNADYYTAYEDEEWFGDLDDEGLFNEQMYKILVGTDCTVVIEGPLANPEGHPITIEEGWNWIGFPVGQVTAIEDAFADFEAEEGDLLKNSDDFTTFEDGEWFGDIEEMEPGQGYMYFSNDADTKTLIYSIGAKLK